MRFLILIIPFVLTLTSCGSAEEKSKNNDFEYELLQKWNGRFLDQKKVEIITDKTGLFKVYSKMNRMITPGLDQPKVDFDKASVLTVPYENKDKNTNDVKLDSVVRKNNTVKVYFKESLNPKNPVNKYFQKKFFILKVSGQPKNVAVKTTE